MKKSVIYFSCLAVVFITSVAPANYEFNQTGACTTQTWSFDTSDNPAIPECYNNNHGTPTAELGTTEIPPDYFGWLQEIDGRQGVWTGEPLEITLTIPNQPIPNTYKEIHLEMEFQNILQWVRITPSPVDNSIVQETYRDISSVGDTQWKKLTIDWYIEPNPSKEKICLNLTGTGGLVNYITVETCCIPEPATMTLLGLGAMALLRTKRS